MRARAQAISSFFESMDMDLHLKKKDFPRGESKGQVAITTPQIAKVYEKMIYRLSLRNRAILLTAKDSGLRVSDLANMDYGYWLQAETIRNEQGETFKVFDPELTQKMKVIAYVHLGPESVLAIEEYLKDRQYRGETLTEKSPLFLDMFGKKMSSDAILLTLRYQVRKLGMKRVSAHSLRKFHKTKLVGAGMPESWVKKLQGKKTDPYTRPEDDISEKYPGFNMLTERYLECYDVLRVMEKSWDKIENERLREELERARAQITESYETNAMDERITNLENQISILIQQKG